MSPAAAELAAELAAQTAEFCERGFATISNALSEAELAHLRAAFDGDRRDHPELWQLRGRSADGGPVGESGRWQTEPLSRTDAFDACIAHPKTFPLLHHLMGDTMRLIHLSAMSRDPVAEPAKEGMQGIHWQMWHREQGAAFAPEHPFCLGLCMVLYMLDDCDAGSHCFSVVPESLAAKKSLPYNFPEDRKNRATVDEPFTKRMWRNRPGSMLSDDILDGVGRSDGVDILGPAGTAIVTNGSNIHAGTVRRSMRARRSIILWWSHGPQNYAPAPESLTKAAAVAGVNRTMPKRLTEHTKIGWLWSQEPLTAEQRWTCLGIGPPPLPTARL